jgi:hypothetical protein
VGLILVSVCQVRVDASEGGQIVAQLRAENRTISDRNAEVQYSASWVRLFTITHWFVRYLGIGVGVHSWSEIIRHSVNATHRCVGWLLLSIYDLILMDL